MNAFSQPVEIVGGGLAGLSLGLALRHAGVPVTIFEAGDYPRQRVCGEFITGLKSHTEATLGLEPILADALPHHEVVWFRHGRVLCRQILPEAAWALSRYDLDARLAEAFVDAGGNLCVRRRVELGPGPGHVVAAGRRRVPSPWVGLKAHVRGLELECGLEMHLGDEAYVGLCALPDGAVNVCGLFRRCTLPSAGPVSDRPEPVKDRPSRRTSALDVHLRASGLADLADRIAAADPEPPTTVAVAGFGFAPPEPSSELRIGDALCMLPPFLGNGMASAFQMAEEALAPLIAWSRDAMDWTAARTTIQTRLQHRFGRRQRWGNAVHSFLLAPRRQRWFAALAGAHCLPLNALYQVLH